MAIRTDPHHTITPQLEVSVYRASSHEPVVSRLELAQARELIGRLSLVAPDDPIVSAAMRGTDANRLLLGLQAFHRIVLERDGCVALSDLEGALWTIPARSVEAIRVELVAGVASALGVADPVALDRAVVPAGSRADSI